MSSDIPICQIPGNSDIAGVGVRASVYAQACLAGLNFLYICHALFSISYNNAAQAEDIEMHSEGATGHEGPTQEASAIGVMQMPVPEVGAAGTMQMPVPGSTEPAYFDDSAPLAPHVSSHLPADPDGPGSNEVQASGRYIPFPTSAPVLRASPTQQRSEPDAISIFVKEQREYLRLVKALERSLFMIGFAVILSAIIEAKSTTGLNPYHALIVLNISQINNWAGFLILSFRGEMRNWGRKPRFGFTFVTKESLYSPGFILFTTHAMLMSGLGLFFWSKPGYFLRYVAGAPQQPCQPITYFWLFGSIDISNKVLRVSSLVFYGISIIPIAGIVLLFVMAGATLLGIGLPVLLVFLLLIFVWVIIILSVIPLIVILNVIGECFSRIPFLRNCNSKVVGMLSGITKPFNAVLACMRSLTSSEGLKFTGSFMVGIFWSAPIIFFMVSTELIIRVNKANVEPEAENKWTYGQTLALFSALAAIGLYVYELYFLVRKRMRSSRVLANGEEVGESLKALRREVVKL